MISDPPYKIYKKHNEFEIICIKEFISIILMVQMSPSVTCDGRNFVTEGI